MIVPVILFTAVGLLFIGLAVPLIKRRIPPNDLYGFRVPETLASEELWYDVNEYSGRQLRLLGIIIIAAVPVLFLAGISETMFTGVMTALLIVGVIAMAIHSFLYLHRRKRL
ncbi:MAG: SdpI family protein [Bacteroidetes bacterium]|nr:SdpI family protein [Bacteroidota bacterium]